jgi:hypothetical protein
MMNENMERQKQIKPLQGKIRNNVNMSQAMNGGMSTLSPIQEMQEMQGIGAPGMQGMGMRAMQLFPGISPGPSSMPNEKHLNRNSGNIYPSDPRMNYPPEMTNSDEEDSYSHNSHNYKYGPRAYSLDKNFKKSHSYNSYDTLESFSDHHKRLNCIDVANHIKSCPICSKFYDNDKTMYVVVIIILVIICIILMKKVLENYEK